MMHDHTACASVHHVGYEGGLWSGAEIVELIGPTVEGRFGGTRIYRRNRVAVLIFAGTRNSSLRNVAWQLIISIASKNVLSATCEM